MKKKDIAHYSELIEKRPSKHTDKLHQIIILGSYTGYDVFKNRAYTYYTYKTKEETFYPASNCNQFLDGLVGTINLSKLKSHYTLIN